MGFLTKSRGKKRKFKPPRPTQSSTSTSSISFNPKPKPYEPPLKKQRTSSSPSNRFFQHTNTSNNNENSNPNIQPKPHKKSFKNPHINSSNISPIDFAKQREQQSLKKYGGPRTWSVFHCKRSNKKHKNYVDGILRHDGKKLYLYDADSAKQITTALWNKKFQKKIEDNEAIHLGSFQIEIDSIINENEFESGQCFNNSNNFSFKPINNCIQKKKRNFKIPSKIDANGIKINMKSQYNNKKVSLKPVTDYTKISNPLILNTAQLTKDFTPKTADTKVICVAAFLSNTLREHQRIGVKYMYECVMGIKNGRDKCGMILADEMGLGKTLQCIALIYTLLNEVLIKKCIIIVPSSLVGNWKKEFNKWILRTKKGKCGIIVMDEKKKSKRESIINTFCGRSSGKNVLIIGYEMLRSHINEVINGNIGLIVCDEGHRLKNSKGNATINALNKIKCNKRILLTGTPIQNNLSELYAMCNWCNPMCLNNISHFKNTYCKPIEASRDANATQFEQKLGDERSKSLNKITTSFILRRTSEEILKKYLKPKDEYIIFHTLSKVQVLLYKNILNNAAIKAIVKQKNIQKALQCILYLRMCCSSPKLAYKKLICSSNLKIQISNNLKQEIMTGESDSEKFRVLINLVTLCSKVNDKIVIVSNYTSILDEIEYLLNVREYKFLRLDGSTNTKQRTKLVSQFNSNKCNEYFIFLLSAKAGGMGLNLIGANRLVLMDPDWNPATDQQAMARIWRDGQKKKCKIYRFITIGSIEEKILQRQIMKNEIADSVVDRHGKAAHKHKDRHFGKDQIKEIFTLKTDIEKCETIEILKENMKDWKVVSNYSLIQTIIPMDYNKQIPVIFQRSVDPKTDPISQWKIKQMDENNNNSNNVMDNGCEFHESDMDSEDEYVLNKNIKIVCDEEEKEEKESEESDIVIINENNSNNKNEKKNRNRFFEENSSDDEEWDENSEVNKRELKHNNNNNNNNNDKEKRIENVKDNNKKERIDDLDVNFDFDDEFC